MQDKNLLDIGFLKYAIDDVLSNKKTLILSAIFFVLISFIYAFNQPVKYTAEFTVSHKEINMFEEVSKENSLADIGGLSFGDNSPLIFQKFKVLIKSYRISEMIVSDPEILIFNDERDKSVSKVYKHLEKNMSISKQGTGNFITISYTSKDKGLSKKLLDYVYVNADLLIKNTQIDSSQKKLDYLYNKLSITQSNIIRTSISKIIAQEESILSIADLDSQFASEIIDYNFYDDSGIITRTIKSIIYAVLIYSIFISILIFYYAKKRIA